MLAVKSDIPCQLLDSPSELELVCELFPTIRVLSELYTSYNYSVRELI